MSVTLPSSAKVLLVDDDASLLQLLAIRIQSKGYEVTTCDSGINALQLLKNQVFDAVITDEDNRGARIQVCDPAVVARVVARSVDPGDDIRVKLVNADPVERRVDFERVG